MQWVNITNNIIQIREYFEELNYSQIYFISNNRLLNIIENWAHHNFIVLGGIMFKIYFVGSYYFRPG